MHVQGSQFQAYACTCSQSSRENNTNNNNNKKKIDRIEHVAEHEGKLKAGLPSQISFWLQI